MAEDEPLNIAIELFQDAYRHQMKGELEEAVELYRESINAYPTAEAYTFLGWTYSFMGDFDAAITECHHAIEVDPDFGNPYNDIGAYLISLGRLDEAVPWLERAIDAPRYDPRHFAHFNLGRVYFAKGMFNRARQCFQDALRIEPRYTLARQAVEKLRHMMN